jgi:hypothetical protein
MAASGAAPGSRGRGMIQTIRNRYKIEKGTGAFGFKARKGCEGLHVTWNLLDCYLFKREVS